MEHNDNSLRLDDVNAAANAVLISQELQPAPKPKRKKLKIIGAILLCLFVAGVVGALLLIPFSGRFEEEEEFLPKTPVFYVSRDGVLFDVSTLDPSILRAAANNSFEGIGLINFHNPVLKNPTTTSGSFVTKLEVHESQVVGERNFEELSDRGLSNYFLHGDGAPPFTTYETYTVETLDGASEEVISSEKLFECESSAAVTRVSCILSEDKLLFKRTFYDDPIRLTKRESYFWFVKSNDQWAKIPLDFGINGDVYIEGFEIVREKRSILFLIKSRTEKKAYVTCYNYQTFAIEKTIELSEDYYSSDVQLRVLSGARYFSAYQYDWERDARDIKCVVFSTTDLTKVKEITIPNVKGRIFPGGPTVVISPDLRYAAYGISDFRLYDVELQREYSLRLFFLTFIERLAAETYQKLYDPDFERKYPCVLVDCAGTYSFGFSKDSRFLFAADLLGNVYQWDVQNKKRARKIINSKY